MTSKDNLAADLRAESDIVMRVNSVSHNYGSLNVLHDVQLDIVRGQIMALVGPSGCGKSTLLRAVLGTNPPADGEVTVNDKVVRGPGRDRGMVYQRYSLYPFLTAEENVAFGLMLDKTSLPFRMFRPLLWRRRKKEFLEQAREWLIKLKLGNAMRHYPHELSGGMRQRVAIAQALIMEPEVLLLDEPFGALDEATREELQEMLLKLYHENVRVKEAGGRPPYTILIVTHELNEAIYVSDRIVGLSQYWGWSDAGHTTPPGATIVYDRVAPIYHPEDTREYEAFLTQRADIRRLVFETSLLQSPGDGVQFWNECAVGNGQGIMKRD